MSSDHSVSAIFNPFNYVFVTQGTVVPAVLGGLGGGDAFCRRQAAMSLNTDLSSRHYVAWLSSSALNAKDRLAPARGWVRPDGLPFADTLAALLDPMRDQVFYLPDLDQFGNAQVAAVATGTTSAGTTSAGVGGAETCGDWRDDAGILTYGFANLGANQWASDVSGSATCGTPQHLYCLSDDYQALVPPKPVPSGGRLAFLTASSLTLSSGIAPLDRLCDAEATDAGFPGAFLAFAAPDDGGTAADRFDADGGAWYRTDGYPLAPTARDWLSATANGPAVTLEVTLGGVHLPSVAWTGAQTPTAPPSSVSNCGGWQSNAATDAGPAEGIVGKANELGPPGFDFTTYGCAGNVHVYCLER
jgi:hypothetical protein